MSVHDAVTTLGVANYRYYARAFGIRQQDRLMHMLLLGQTGTGKSTLLQNMIRQDAQAGRGLCLVEPHGDLASTLTAQLGVDHIYWDLADPNCVYGYNPLAAVSPPLRPLVVSGFIETLKKQWHDAWGPRMEHLLRYALLALLETPGSDLRGVLRLFMDRQFRREVVARVSDEQTRQFWTQEFPALNYKNAGDGVGPIMNKLGALLANPVVRHAICTPREPLRFRSLMDQGKVLIVNLAKGKIGADTANVIGGLVVASVMNAAFSRHNLPEQERQPFFLYADEFHNFSTQAFAVMLSETRKYALGVCVSNQFFAQQERGVFEAIMGNIGSLISFRTGVLDAPLIARQLQGVSSFRSVSAYDLIRLPNHHIYAQLMVDGVKSEAFSAKTLRGV